LIARARWQPSDGREEGVWAVRAETDLVGGDEEVFLAVAIDVGHLEVEERTNRLVDNL